jgi:multimeric flavodoxin WrbA
MKVTAVSGSPRKDGNTARALSIILKGVESEGFETELISLAGKRVHGCIACMRCREKRDNMCYGVRDDLNEVIDACNESNAIILGTPVYFGSATPEIKSLIDRLGYTSKNAATNKLYRKIGGAVVIARRAGQNFTSAQFSYFFNIMGMVQVGSSYWNILFGREKGDIETDREGIQTLENYSENLLWLLKKLNG